MANLAHARFQRGLHEQAQRLFLDAIAGERALPGERGPDFPVKLLRYAETLEALNDLTQAERVVAEALSLNLRIFGDVHPAVAISRAHHARIRCARGAVDEAAAAYEDAIAMLAATTSPSNPRLAALREELRNCTTR
jgi:tetratricopeptide (TPR) repeat protein